MTPELLVSYASMLGSVILSVAFLLTVYRVIIGPTLPDRIVALDMLVGIAIGFIALIAIRAGYSLYIDIAIALGLVGFLATVAFARFIMSRNNGQDTDSSKGNSTKGNSLKAKYTKGNKKHKAVTAHSISAKNTRNKGGL